MLSGAVLYGNFQNSLAYNLFEPRCILYLGKFLGEAAHKPSRLLPVEKYQTLPANANL
jgi:hypothetical protein